MRQSGALPHRDQFCLKTIQAWCSDKHLRHAWFGACLLMLASGFLGTFGVAEVQAAPLPSLTTEQSEAAPAGNPQQSPRLSQPLLDDGIYLYGEASTPDVLGHSYMVFAAQGERVVGAIYMPLSSFDCFQGEITAAALNLEITNSYTQEVYRYAIATAASEPIASELGGPLTAFMLQDFHNLGEPREADLALLQICQAEFLPGAELEI